MKILALDQATKTGWATDTASGVWNLTPNRGETGGMRIVRFKAKVLELIELEGIELIAYERVQGRFQNTVIINAELAGILQVIAIEKGIPLACYSPKEIKVHATGKGNANKDMMLKAAREKWPNINIIDDNQADALWILDLAKSRLI